MLIYGKDGAARGAVLRVFKVHRQISRPVNKLCPIQNIENRKKELNDANETIVVRNHPRREAVVIGDFKRRAVMGEC